MRHLFRAVLPWCLAILITSACSPPPDPVEMGSLCYSSNTPESCTTQVTLERGTVLGRNAVDYRIRNNGASNARAVVLAGPAELFESLQDAGTSTDMSTNPTNPNINDPELIEVGIQRVQTLAAGETFTDRLLPSELGREARIWVELRCSPASNCDLAMEYVLVVEPVECTAKEDCPSGWECDTERGLCAECIAGEEESNCTEDQTCQLGRCTPPQQTSCQSAPGHDPGLPSLPTMLFGLATLGLLSRERKRAAVIRRMRGASWRRGGVRHLAARTLLAFVVGASAWWWVGGKCDAFAADPPPGARAELTLGAGPRFFTGEIGAQTSRGLGINVGQELRLKYVGAGIDLSAATFVASPIDSGAPPYLRSFLTHSVMIGPHVYVPIWRDVELTLDVSYERLGLAANSLVGLTGLELGRHGGAASGRVRYTFAPLIAQFEVGYHLYPGFPGDMISVTLMIGVTDF